MGRNQRDEPKAALIADCGDTSTGDEKEHINLVIDALQSRGIVKLA